MTLPPRGVDLGVRYAHSEEGRIVDLLVHLFEHVKSLLTGVGGSLILVRSESDPTRELVVQIRPRSRDIAVCPCPCSDVGFLPLSPVTDLSVIQAVFEQFVEEIG